MVVHAPIYDEGEAVRVANNSRYGLSAYVRTGDPERAWRIANRLNAGTVNIGPAFYLSPDTPFGGYGISGVGRPPGTGPGRRPGARSMSAARTSIVARSRASSCVSPISR
jgi:acyl-CoA reductase-like NAD-dependent aldehyde dehydrogenase